ncbi:MAG: hypothetical protein IPP77_15740 [Bacteroidetes bacterium]|nr:hypothetical protein [Bacteroidota bacterium]
MKKQSPIFSIVLIMFFLSVFVAALAIGNPALTTETAFVKQLKEKFRNFYEKASEDRVYLQTDKSFYKPGETIWFTAYVRAGETLKPSGSSDVVHVEFITPKGSTEKHLKLVAINGIAKGDFDLSAHPGGIYKIKAYTEWQKNEDSSFQFEKDITVQNVVMPRLKMKLDFEKKAYGKGDVVVANLELNTNENKALASTAVKFITSVAGKDITEGTVTTDALGKANLKFTLPKDLDSPDGIINALIDFEGSTESISRSIPIVLNQIKMEFFPEGGDMVSNIKARIAFRALNEFGKPADVEELL